jgi:hypothetical protein
MSSPAFRRVVERPRCLASATSSRLAAWIADQMASSSRLLANRSKKCEMVASSAALMRAKAACAEPTASAASCRSRDGISSTSRVASTTTTASPAWKRLVTSAGTSIHWSPPHGSSVPSGSLEIGLIVDMIGPHVGIRCMACQSGGACR